MVLYYILYEKVFLLFVLRLLTKHVQVHSTPEVYLRGAGASFPKEIYKRWLIDYEAYRQNFVKIIPSYESVGSGKGKRWIMDKSISLEYAGSDALLTAKEYAEDPGLQMFPTVAGALVLGFNIPGITQLNLTRENIVGIYNGTYTKWNSPDIAAINPDISLPSEDIVVIAKSSKSGSTEMFTKALANISEKWSADIGYFSLGLNENYEPIYWPSGVVDYFGAGSTGTSGLIMSIRYSIGYLSLADANLAGMTYAHMTNRAGYFVDPSHSSIQNAIDGYSGEVTNRLTLDIMDDPGDHSYPLTAYTYFIVHMYNMTNCDSAVELWRYIDWFLTSENARIHCREVGFVCLKGYLAERVRTEILGKIRCNGQLVADLAEIQILDELQATQIWRKVIKFTLPLCFIILGMVLVYPFMQQLKMHHTILRNKWRISLERIKFYGQPHMKKSLSKIFSMRSLHNMSTHNFGHLWLSQIEKVGILDHEQFVHLNELKGPYEIHLNMKYKTKKLILYLREHIIHVNLTKYMGICYIDDVGYSVSEFCNKGRLPVILQNTSYQFDDNFKFSLVCDITRGLRYLHKKHIVHGHLSSAACYLDNRWNVKIGDWFLNLISISQGDGNATYHQYQVASWNHPDGIMSAQTMFWTPPEQLNDPTLQATTDTDIYAMALIIVEVFTMDIPYSEERQFLSPIEIIVNVKTKGMRPKLRPDFPGSLITILETSWHWNPLIRPSASKLKYLLEESKPSKTSVFDCMMEAIEEYTLLLEDKVAERTRELQQANQKTTDLLHKMLPPLVADKLSEGQSVDPEYFDSVTIFFSDIVGFTNLAGDSTPMEIVTMLNDLYTIFDDIVHTHDVYKVETIGDAYMVISGAPIRNDIAHAFHICSMAVALAFAADHFVIRHKPDTKLQLRAGIHSGSVCTGVVGIKMPRYCIFGDTVNTASRMESTSIAQKVQVSQTTKELLDKCGTFLLESRGVIQVKGKGEMNTFWLVGRDQSKMSLETLV